MVRRGGVFPTMFLESVVDAILRNMVGNPPPRSSEEGVFPTMFLKTVVGALPRKMVVNPSPRSTAYS